MSLWLVGCLAATPQNESAPRIVNEKGEQRLELPATLTTLLTSTFPQDRLATSKEVGGGCQVSGGTGDCPFAVWSDFNQDGRLDVALILLGAKRWILAIFNGTDGGFSLAYKDGAPFDPEMTVQSPGQLSLSLFKKGKPVEWDREEGGKASRKFDNDSILLSFLEASETYIYWENGKYETLVFAD
jgi:hypothetical protein